MQQSFYCMTVINVHLTLNILIHPIMICILCVVNVNNLLQTKDHIKKKKALFVFKSQWMNITDCQRLTPCTLSSTTAVPCPHVEQLGQHNGWGQFYFNSVNSGIGVGFRNLELEMEFQFTS